MTRSRPFHHFCTFPLRPSLLPASPLSAHQKGTHRAHQGTGGDTRDQQRHLQPRTRRTRRTRGVNVRVDFNLIASLLLVAMPFVTSSFLLLVVRPGAPSSFLLLVAMPFVTSSVLLFLVVRPGAPSSFLLLVAMPFVTSSVLLFLIAMASNLIANSWTWEDNTGNGVWEPALLERFEMCTSLQDSGLHGQHSTH